MAARLSARSPTCSAHLEFSIAEAAPCPVLLEQAREHAVQLGHPRSKLEEKERELQSVTEALKRFW